MVWPFSSGQQQSQNSGALNLGLANGAQTMNQPAQFGFGQPQQQNPFMSGLGVPQQPVAPPSELEIIAMLQQSATPVDAWLAGQGFQQMLGAISSLVALNLVEFFREAKFVDDGDDGLKLDISSLPAPFSTMSAENITAELVTLQQVSNAAVQAGIQRQQQILMMAQQSMMGGALNAALQNDSLMEKAGGAAGGLMRGAFNAATGMR
tara:strand:+ start:3879 stop:4499 length:621 start_codon:yes stop_codon:yes gene_type:complete